MHAHRLVGLSISSDSRFFFVLFFFCLLSSLRTKTWKETKSGTTGVSNERCSENENRGPKENQQNSAVVRGDIGIHELKFSTLRTLY